MVGERPFAVGGAFAVGGPFAGGGAFAVGGRWARAALLGVALIAGAVAPAAAQCRLGLALGFDVSASVDQREYRLMMQGTATALMDPQVQAAVFSGPPVALSAFVWAGAREQAIAAWWRVIDTPQDLAEFADRLASFPRPDGDPLRTWGGRTGVGGAMAAAGQLLDQAPGCDALTLDLAGDGPSNDGPDAVPLPGVTVNALAVGGDLPLDHDGAVDGLSLWYGALVIQGPGAFVMIANGFEDFADAMQRKLLRELMPALLGALDP